ncbi:MAG: hypothetical protein ACI4M3_02730 [Acutalibacteraceae bacterium]
MKKTATNIFLVLVYIAVVGYLLFSGIYDVCGFNKYYETKIVAASELFETEHSINGLIPVGTDYYYVGLTDDEKFVVMRASKDWLSKNFDENGIALSEDGLTVKGTLKSLSYNERGMVEDSLGDYQNISILGTNQSLDIMYFDVAVHSIISGSLLILCGIAGLLIWKNQKVKALLKNNVVLIGVIIAFVAILIYVGYAMILK